MNYDLQKIEAVIFDLGGVLLNINYHLTSNAFKVMGVQDFDKTYSQAQQSSLFDDFETGRISPAEFRNQLRMLMNMNFADEQIDEAWNAMLLDFPEARMELLERVSLQKRIFLLSNTNAIHIEAFKKIIGSGVGYDRFIAPFEKVYYSSSIGMRKPHPATFTWVVKENNLDPKSTLFIDDSIQHVIGAREAGLNAEHLQIDILDKLG